MDTWTFIWLVAILKIPIVALFLLVRWAVLQTPDSAPEEDGGIGPRSRPPHPHHPRSRPSRRRGPHGEPSPDPPRRVRLSASGRRLRQT